MPTAGFSQDQTESNLTYINFRTPRGDEDHTLPTDTPTPATAPLSDQPKDCFHCGLPVPDGSRFQASIDGESRAMCCAGCAAVANAIDQAGLSGYYRHRTARPRSPRDLVPDELDQLSVYDHDAIQRSFVTTLEGDRREANLVLEGIQCAACIWLNEKHLQSLPGVIEASVNYSTQQARVVWDNGVIRLSRILAAIEAIGYQAHPYDPGRQQQALNRQRREMLKRLGVGAAFGMQVMILAVALYTGEWYGMDPAFESLFRKLALLLTLPVLVYSGRDFFRNAWTDLRLRRVSMDVPVSLGLALAFGASTLHVIQGSGAVYFESVCMFVLFLQAARYFELNGRIRAVNAAESVGYVRPAAALRLDPDEAGDARQVAAVELEPDDLVLVRPGDIVPADGIVVDGESGLDESILTGESAPVRKLPGDPVIGGSVNADSPLRVRVTRTGGDTVVAEIHRLLGQAMAGKPAIARLADRVAAWFVVGVLTIAGAVAAFWLWRGEADWLGITVSVLVVSCPCALSLAVPTAISTAITRLMREHVLVASERALETLPRVDRFVFDKTGTLTIGRPVLVAVEPVHGDADRWLTIAAALESASEHPIARAIRDAAGDRPRPRVSDLRNVPGEGVSGTIDGSRYRLGNRRHAGADWPDPPTTGDHPDASEILLSREQQPCCRFLAADALRDDAPRVVADLRRRGCRVFLMSGDNPASVAAAAAALGIDDFAAGCTPQDKLERVRHWQSRGEVVAMVGDGVNDAPVLAGADVSASVAGATAAAVTSADIVSLSSRIGSLVDTLDVSRAAMRVMRQNLWWAVGYNTVAIPAAAAGMVTPWLAALGMSASSLLVIGNAGRLRRKQPVQ